jgi:hypothetical protein
VTTRIRLTPGVANGMVRSIPATGVDHSRHAACETTYAARPARWLAGARDIGVRGLPFPAVVASCPVIGQANGQNRVMDRLRRKEVTAGTQIDEGHDALTLTYNRMRAY